MIKLYVNETELEPIGLGARKGNDGENEIIVVNFHSDKDVKEIIALFDNLPDDAVIKLQDEVNELVYKDYTSMKDEVNVKYNEDGTFDYTVCLKKKTSDDIMKKLVADVEYLTVVSGAEA